MGCAPGSSPIRLKTSLTSDLQKLGSGRQGRSPRPRQYPEHSFRGSPPSTAPWTISPVCATNWAASVDAPASQQGQGRQRSRQPTRWATVPTRPARPQRTFPAVSSRAKAGKDSNKANKAGKLGQAWSSNGRWPSRWNGQAGPIGVYRGWRRGNRNSPGYGAPGHRPHSHPTGQAVAPQQGPQPGRYSSARLTRA